MKKNITRILAVFLCLFILATGTAFAGDAFKLVETSPEKDSSNTVASNVAIKLIFSTPVSSEASQTANAGLFSIVTTVTDDDGNESEYEVPYTELYNADKYPNEVWLQCDEDLVTTSTYTVTVDGSMVDDNGTKLGSDEVFSFTVRDTKRDNRVYTLLMIVFMIVMIAFSVRDAARQARGDKGGSNKKKADNTVNPYKEAKKKGKSVEEVKAETEKKKQKAAEKAAKIEAQKEEIRKEIEKERAKAKEKARQKKYRVMRKAPISKAGYKTPKAYRKKK